jgi:hypothetical protein
LKLDRGKGGTNLFLFISSELHGDRAEVFFEMGEFVVPGIGTIHGFSASSQPSANWAG